MNSKMVKHAHVLQSWKQHRQLFERLFAVAEVLAEFGVAVVVGLAVGWLVGFCVGRAYVAHYQPVYLSQLGSLSKISEWSVKPFVIADIGAYVGGFVGALAAVISRVRASCRL